MNIRKAALITTTLLFMLTGVMAQTGSISGSVIDGSGAALAGANVMVEGTDLGAATDVGGNYSISGVSTGTHTVTASFVGYQSSSQSAVVGVGNNTVNFSLAISAIAGREVAVIGSRFSHTAEDLAVPVDVFTAAEIRATGFAETAQILQALAPSFNMPRTSISDGSDTVRPMTLRGLGSGQVLVLVNGKRRHTTALVHVNNSPSRGDTGVDLNAIPAAAIERIEVLRDGAAAQYGSDAIAGAINIVLKSGNSGGSYNVYTGLCTSFAIMQALFMRERTGEGQFVDSAMLDNMISLNERMVMLYSITGEEPHRGRLKHLYPRGAFKCRDGYLALNVPDDLIWARLCRVIEREDLIEDERSRNGTARASNADFLDSIIESWLKARTREEAEKTMNSSGIPVGSVYTAKDIFASAQVKARKMLLEIEDPDIGKNTFSRGPVVLSSSPEPPRSPAPELGQNSREILKKILEKTDEEISQLANAGIIQLD